MVLHLLQKRRIQKKFWQDITPETKLSKTNVKFDVQTGIEKVWLDGRVEATLDKSVPQIGSYHIDVRLLFTFHLIIYTFYL